MSAKSKNQYRKEINLDAEIANLRVIFDNVKDNRANNASHKLSDILMSGFAMFSLKHSSLLDFQEQNHLEKMNLKTVFGIEKVCSDTQLRDVLDGVNPNFIRELFPKNFERLGKIGLLDEYKFKIGATEYLIVSCDGVQHFSSKKISCPCCLTKQHKDGTVTCHHNMLCAALVNPEKRETFLLDIEPIIQQDGKEKNDCERNAANRLQEKVKKNYEEYQKKYNFLFVEDALYANVPHIEILINNGFNYILNIKPDSHKTLFAYTARKKERKEVNTYTYTEKGIKHEFEYVNNALLCNNSPTTRVNWLRYIQTDKKGKKTVFTWITNIKITDNKLIAIMKAGRARWKIENETFNTLKNLGYHFEHNYGHGKNHLSTMFAYLMLLAFYIDQLIQACCHKFEQIEKNISTKIKIWATIKAIFQTNHVSSINDIYRQVAFLFQFKLE